MYRARSYDTRGKRDRLEKKKINTVNKVDINNGRLNNTLLPLTVLPIFNILNLLCKRCMIKD